MRMVCGVSNARISRCSPGMAATQRLPPGPCHWSKAQSMGASATSEVTHTVAIAAMSFAPDWGALAVDCCVRRYFRSMVPPNLYRVWRRPSTLYHKYCQDLVTLLLPTRESFVHRTM